MHKVVLTLIASLFCSAAFSQNVFIPNPVFRTYLTNNYPNCMNGDSLNTSCTEVLQQTTISLWGLGIGDISGIEHFVNLTILDCGGNDLTSIQALPPQLQHLNCRDNNLTSLPDLPNTLVTLLAYENDLMSLPELPASLLELDCHENNLTSLPELPTGLQVLEIQHNELTTLPASISNVSFLTLNCYNNQLTSITDLPVGLSTLNCQNNNITNFPEIPSTVTRLNCSNNLLSSLPTLPSGMYDLYCDDNDLTQLPALPETLRELRCMNNEITSLPELINSNLDHLYCGGNQLTFLPVFPFFMQTIHCENNQLSNILLTDGIGSLDLNCSHNNITEITTSADWLFFGLFDCSYNDLTSLPFSQLQFTSVNELNCSHNELTSLPIELVDWDLYSLDCSYNQISILHSELVQEGWLSELNCSNNQINWLPEFTEFISAFDCSNNNLNCLPISLFWNVGTGDLIFTPGNNITCIPDGQNAEFYSDFFGLPICNASFMNGCDFRQVVQGSVFFDMDSDCSPDFGEFPLNNWVVESDQGTYAVTDSSGQYSMWVYPFTTYELSISSPVNNLFDITCPNIPYTITPDTLQDTIADINFPIEVLEYCSWPTVSLSATTHRPCFSNNHLQLYYCNDGTGVAEDAYIDLTVPANVILLSSSMPWNELGNDIYRFQLGDLEIGECGSIHILDSVTCDLDLISHTECFEAEIFPISDCFEGDPKWNQASIKVNGACDGSNIEFVIKNVGAGDMTESQPFTVYRNNQIFSSEQSVSLPAGDSLIVPIIATGETFSLKLDQVEGHPGNDMPRAIVEACGPEPHALNVIQSIVQNDQNDHIDIECVTFVASYDPNDKRVSPAGYGPLNFVNPEVSLLEYTIRFQNTGNDTAFNVQVIDTLPAQFVNPATFESLNSSHPYEVFMYDSGIVVWSFDNILLPDSNVNEPESNGFVKFKIRTREDLPLGTVINNTAAIYFDFNEAVITENCFITLAEEESIITDLRQPEVALTVVPNPFHESCLISFDREVNDGLVQVSDATGRIVFTKVPDRNKIIIDSEGLEPGVYLIQLIEKGQLLGTSRTSFIGN